MPSCSIHAVCDPMDRSLLAPLSKIFQGRILEKVAIPLVLNKEHLCLLLLRLLFLCQLRFFNCK